jgi:hypothetical protein
MSRGFKGKTGYPELNELPPKGAARRSRNRIVLVLVLVLVLGFSLVFEDENDDENDEEMSERGCPTRSSFA